MAMPMLALSTAVAVQVERLAQRLAHLVGRVDGVLLVARHRQDQREFVAAHAPDRVAQAHALHQPVAELAQQLVAEPGAERVVDVLEAVQRDEQHHHAPRFLLRQRDGVGQRLEEQGAVGQAGQAVVVRHVLQQFLRLAPLADVARHAQHDGRLAGTLEQLPVDLDRHRHQVAPHQFQFGQLRRARLADGGGVVVEPVRLGAQQRLRAQAQPAGRLPQHLVARVAQHAAGAVVDVDQFGAGRVEQEDGVGGGVHRAAKALQLDRALAHRVLQARVVVARLAVQQAHLEHVADAREHLDRVDRLAEEIARARFERLEFMVGLRRHHQHRQPRVRLERAQRVHHFEAVHAWHLQVEDDEVVAVAGVPVGHHARIGGGADGLVAGRLE
jgi:hypothetical protein